MDPAHKNTRNFKKKASPELSAEGIRELKRYQVKAARQINERYTREDARSFFLTLPVSEPTREVIEAQILLWQEEVGENGRAPIHALAARLASLITVEYRDNPYVP